MAFKDVLLTLATYPEPTPLVDVDHAIDVVAAIGAKLSAIACEVKIELPGSFLSTAFINVPGMAAAETKTSVKNADELLAYVRQTADRRGIANETLRERCLVADVASVFAETARFHDLTIVSKPDGDGIEQWFAEEIVFGSGRPALIIPQARPGSAPAKFETIVVAWDFSRAAARSVADALPFLSQAKQVRVVTIVNEKTIATRRSASELAKHLASHGANATLETVDASGRAIGDVLQDYVAANAADLLVMGAYGHSRIREFILGGATRSMLFAPPVPLLLSH